MTSCGREGVGLALAAYSMFAVCDALIKSLGGRLGVFEIGAFTAGAGGVVVLAIKPRGESWREALRIRRFWAVEARALAGVCSSCFGIYALTRLPLGDVYALVFLAPLFVTAMGAALLKESVGAVRWAAIGLGFAGVLLVVRPGFETPELAHLAAAAVAVSMATGVIILRTAASGESRTAVLAVLMANTLIFYIVALLLGPAPPLPSGGELARVLTAGLFGAGGQAALVAATRRAAASRIAPAQYCQLAWGVAFGALFFAERPDALKVAGLALIGGAGLIAARSGAGTAAGEAAGQRDLSA